MGFADKPELCRRATAKKRVNSGTNTTDNKRLFTAGTQYGDAALNCRVKSRAYSASRIANAFSLNRRTRTMIDRNKLAPDCYQCSAVVRCSSAVTELGAMLPLPAAGTCIRRAFREPGWMFSCLAATRRLPRTQEWARPKSLEERELIGDPYG